MQMQISSVWFWFVVFRNTSSWAIVSPKCFQKCFISLFSIHHGCHHCPVQMSTPTPACAALLAPSSSSHAHKQVGLCSNTGTSTLAFTCFLKWGQPHHTPMTAPFRAEKWAWVTGGLPLFKCVLFELQKLFLEHQRKLKKPWDSLSSSPLSDLSYPHSFGSQHKEE